MIVCMNEFEPRGEDDTAMLAGGSFLATLPSRRNLLMKSSITLVTFGCAAAVAMALVGAAYALDAPKATEVVPLLKGDRIAVSMPSAPTTTVEEVNADAGISNLITVPSEPTRP